MAQLGLDTFGIQAGLNGELLSHAQVIRNVIDDRTPRGKAV